MTIYGGGTLEDVPEIVRGVRRHLSRHLGKFDFMAVRGMSGVVVGSPLSIAIKKPLVIVRKEGENSHGTRIINGDQAIGRFIFFDDFIETGNTRRIVVDEILSHSGVGFCEYVGTYTYEPYRSQLAWGEWPL